MAASAVTSKPTAFIIHGRDLEARDSVALFLEELGLTVLPFADLSLGLGPSAVIGDIVLASLKKADVLIALFTPDEQAALYDPTSRRLIAGETRWQARQNVIFEAGIAIALHRPKTIIVTMGADVKLLSDLWGIHVADLSNQKGGQTFLDKLRYVLPQLPNKVPTAKLLQIAARWDYYDDVESILASMESCPVGRGRVQITLLELMRRTVVAENKWSWSNHPRPRVLMKSIAGKFSAAVTNDAYWWLVVFGFFQFEEIDQFYEGEGENWQESIEYCIFAPRAGAIWQRIRSIAI